MGEIFKNILLGIIQGLSEFLPISSSGHLELAKVIFDSNYNPEESMMVTVVLHVATSLSTIVVFRKDIAEIFNGLFQFKWNAEVQFTVKIMISMIPAAFVGLVFKDFIEQILFGNNILVKVGGCLILTALLLMLADKAKSTSKGVGYFDALIIGVSQAIAIMPGISRSGSTISTSVLLGIDRKKAARFSFLMAVPLILAAQAKDVLDGDLSLGNIDLTALIAGFIAAFITGLIACNWMIKLIQRSQLKYFSYYCLVAGSVAICYVLIS